MPSSLELETRKKIYEFIAEHPGGNLSSLAGLRNMSIPFVDYHTRFLEDNELISITKESGCFKRYYIRGEIGEKEKRLLGILRQEIPLRIVLFLLEHPLSQH